MLSIMDVACPVLPSQHADYHHSDGAVSRHHRLPLQESTGNVQAHAGNGGNGNGNTSYCSPVLSQHVPVSMGGASSTTASGLPLVGCTTTTPPHTIPTPPILSTQTLGTPSHYQHLHQPQHHHQAQPIHPGYYSGSVVKSLPSQQPYQQDQQLFATRQQSITHHGGSSSSLALAGSGYPGGNFLGASPGYGPSGFANQAAAAVAAAAAITAANNNKNVNPIYLSPQFQAYRKKQGEKDDKTEQIWPDVLEDAFLDALLLIPQMGRKKYAMRGQLHGRNMLISEYLWVAYCLTLPPGAKPDRKMARGRKQVSSHIQVLKNFFIHHRCYHFFFPSKEKKEDARKELLEKESFKDNAVLRALFEGRLPDEKPNYEYFGQLLASDALVAIRPNLCWILVSSSAVRFEGGSDGNGGGRRGVGSSSCQAFKSSDSLPLDNRLYPHLHLNMKREEWPEHGKIIRGTLLQEYTRALSQKEASSVRDISCDWEERFPGQLCDTLDEVVRDDLRDILHFHVTLDVQEPDRFPEGAELNSLVEVSIEQPGLQNHRWKSVTRLARPWELMPGGQAESSGDLQASNDEGQPPVSVITREIGNQYLHRPGCHGVGNGGHCDCFHNARLRRQRLAVPFPAPEWATMLSMLTGFRKHPLDAGHHSVHGAYGTTSHPPHQQHRAAKRGGTKRSSYGSTATTTTGSTSTAYGGVGLAGGGGEGEDGCVGDDSFASHSTEATSVGSATSGGGGGAPTQMDLVRNIAMLQELWSCAPSGSSALDGPSPPSQTDGSSDNPVWVRRAVILWTFETIYSVNEKKMEVVKSPAGTGWRFLTTIDPTSQYHQQQALVTPAGAKSGQGQRRQSLVLNSNNNNSISSSSSSSSHHGHHGQLAVQPHTQAPPLPPHQHQHQHPMAYLPPAVSSRRNSVMSPHPGYQQHLNAAMSEHLTAAAAAGWDGCTTTGAGTASSSNNSNNNNNNNNNNNINAGYRQHHSISPQPLQSHHQQHQQHQQQQAAAYGIPSPMSLLDTTSVAFGAGLTPPPTASLPSPYATSYEEQQRQQQSAGGVSSSQQPHHHHHHHQHQHQHQHNPYAQHQQGFPSQLSFMSASSGSDTDSAVAAAAAAALVASGGGGGGGDGSGNGGGGAPPSLQSPPNQSVIDPFLTSAGGGGAGDGDATMDAGAGGHHHQQQPTALPDWDANDMKSALDVWPPADHQQQQLQHQLHQHGLQGGSAVSQTGMSRGQKRGRPDSIDETSAYPVASIPKLSHNGFSNGWR